MIELILIRHGETDWNLARRLQGHVDIALNDTGRRQALALAERLAGETLDAVVCSDLQRAVQTAQQIAQRHNLTCRIEAQWRERNFGGFEGQLVSTLEQRFPLENTAWRKHEVDGQFPANADGSVTGETIRTIHMRVEQALLSLCRQNNTLHQARKIAVVAHGGVLECVYRMARQLPLNAARQVSMHNASINRLRLYASAGQIHLELIEWGDVAHLSASIDEIER